MRLRADPFAPYPPGMLRASDIQWGWTTNPTDASAYDDHADAMDVPFTVDPLPEPVPREHPRQLKSWAEMVAARGREPGEEG